MNKYLYILLQCTFHKIDSQVECAPLLGPDWPCLADRGLGVAKGNKTKDEIKILILDTKEFLRNHLEFSSIVVTFYEKSTKNFGRVSSVKQTSLYIVEPVLQGNLHF